MFCRYTCWAWSRMRSLSIILIATCFQSVADGKQQAGGSGSVAAFAQGQRGFTRCFGKGMTSIKGPPMQPLQGDSPTNLSAVIFRSPLLDSRKSTSAGREGRVSGGPQRPRKTP